MKRNISEKSEILRLEVDYSNLEDVRTLIVRVSRNTLEKFYDNVSEYRDGTPVLIENRDRKARVIAQGPLKAIDERGEAIRMDEWVRNRLNVKVGDKVTVKKTIFTPFILFWNTMVFRHPNISQRWENFGIFLAIATLILDVFLRMVELSFSLEALSFIAIVVVLAFVFLPPMILVPRR